MTRHSITTVLGWLLVALLVIVRAPMVYADAPCSGNAQELCETMENRVPGQNPAADAAQQYRQEMDAAAQAATLLATRSFSVPLLRTGEVLCLSMYQPERAGKLLQ
jgi:hypothetical protein